MSKDKLTLDKEVTYHITVPGDVNQYRNGGEKIKSSVVEQDQEGKYTTTFVCQCDQAGLHGLLRSLYSKGLPLLKIICDGFGNLFND